MAIKIKRATGEGVFTFNPGEEDKTVRNLVEQQLGYERGNGRLVIADNGKIKTIGPYDGIMNTASTEAVKIVQIPYENTLAKGQSIKVYCVNAHGTTADVSLSVTFGSAVAVTYGVYLASNGLPVDSANTWGAKTINTFIFDGAKWLLMDTLPNAMFSYNAETNILTITT